MDALNRLILQIDGCSRRPGHSVSRTTYTRSRRLDGLPGRLMSAAMHHHPYGFEHPVVLGEGVLIGQWQWQGMSQSQGTRATVRQALEMIGWRPRWRQMIHSDPRSCQSIIMEGRATQAPLSAGAIADPFASWSASRIHGLPAIRLGGRPKRRQVLGSLDRTALSPGNATYGLPLNYHHVFPVLDIGAFWRPSRP